MLPPVPAAGGRGFIYARGEAGSYMYAPRPASLGCLTWPAVVVLGSRHQGWQDSQLDLVECLCCYIWWSLERARIAGGLINWTFAPRRGSPLTRGVGILFNST